MVEAERDGNVAVLSYALGAERISEIIQSGTAALSSFTRDGKSAKRTARPAPPAKTATAAPKTNATPAATAAPKTNAAPAAAAAPKTNAAPAATAAPKAVKEAVEAVKK
jgi:hypothetical protein